MINYRLRPIMVLVGWLCLLPNGMEAQENCYQPLKKAGDAHRDQQVYEEAISQYLAAILCRDLTQAQQIYLINQIKACQQARVEQLKSANRKTLQALGNVVDNLLQSSERDILNLDYRSRLG